MNCSHSDGCNVIVDQTGDLCIFHLEVMARLAMLPSDWQVPRGAFEKWDGFHLTAFGKGKHHALFPQGRQTAEHGSLQMYQRYRCRCVECRAVKSEEGKRHRRRMAA